MANSFSFNSIDMSAYGLRLRTHNEPFNQDISSVQLLDKAYGLSSTRPAKLITLDVVVHAADIATLKSYLDSIRSVLNQREDKMLEIDTFSDRYWIARFAGMEGSITTARVWEGTITFTAHDPAAYDNTETDHDHTVDEDPEDFEEDCGGTEQARPVITLTCDDADEVAEDFEWGGDGTALSTSGGNITWSISVAGSSKAEIDTSQHYAGTRSACLYRDGANNAAAYFSRTALGSQEEIELWVRKDDTSALTITHGNGTRRITVNLTTAEGISYYDGALKDTGFDVTVDTWHLLTIRNVDWDAGTYDIYLDDFRIKQGATMATDALYANQIFFSNTEGNSLVWLDNIKAIAWYQRTIEINNEETGEIFTWIGEFHSFEELVIDCSAYTVELEGEDAISGLQDGSEFPCLLPGQNNTIVVSGFSGNCNLTYRARYV